MSCACSLRVVVVDVVTGYPSEQCHKVPYRGPYVKGPADKPLLDGETVRGLVR